MSTSLAVLTNPTAIDFQQVQHSHRSWILAFTTFGTLASHRQTCSKEIFSRPSLLWKSWTKFCGEGAFRFSFSSLSSSDLSGKKLLSLKSLLPVTAIGEWSLPVFPLTHELAIVFFSLSCWRGGSNRAARRAPGSQPRWTHWKQNKEFL